jgi:uncharacterized membrane protein YjjP (DUF1212 family)
VGDVENAHTHVARVRHQELDLRRLTLLRRLVRRIVADTLSVEEASAELTAVMQPTEPWGAKANAVVYAVSAAGAAVVLQGGWMEAAVATVVGALVGAIVALTTRRESLASIAPLLAGLVASFGTGLFAGAVHPIVLYIPTLAAIITLLPGMTLTIAMNELAHEHSVSGGARLTGAMLTLLQLGFGVALGKQLASAAVGASVPIEPAMLGAAWVTIAAAAIVVSFALRSNAPLRDVPALLLVAGAGLGAGKLGAAYLGPELGTAGSAWLVGVLANLVSRRADIPVLTTVLPAILLMVPGSVGFSSMSAFIEQDVVVGLQGVTSMVLIAFALVTGLLLANLTSRPTDLF